jgi:hypothetical protein
MVLEVRLLGAFAVATDHLLVDDKQWFRRQAALVVKMLALAPRQRLHQEQITETLWPGPIPTPRPTVCTRWCTSRGTYSSPRCEAATTPAICSGPKDNSASSPRRGSASMPTISRRRRLANATSSSLRHELAWR